MRYAVAALIALLILVGIPAQATNAQTVVTTTTTYYTDWLAGYYQPEYAVAPAYYPSYYVRPYYRPWRSWLTGYSACWYRYC